MEDARAAPATGSEIVIVPRVPGAVIVPRSGRAPDELDELIDDIFGPDTGDPPGRLDLILLLGGAALLLWAVLGLHSTGLAVLGGVLAFLGSVLPARSLWRKTAAARSGRRRKAVSAEGLVLNATHPLTHELIAAYGDLLAAAVPGSPFGSEARSAAHLALTESATLVGEEGPATPAETEYLERRVTALRALTAQLRRQGETEAEPDDRAVERKARALAGEELDAAGTSSLSDLDDLTRVLADSDG